MIVCNISRSTGWNRPVHSGRLNHVRRGVASVLAMMFLVIFASLAAVMAVVAQGNMRTAQSSMQVYRSMSAAETGLIFAARRLSESSARFVVERGTVDSDFADKLWNGTWSSGDGQVLILDPVGFVEGNPATSVVTALLNSHDADVHNLILDPGDELLPAIDEFGKLSVRPIAVSAEEDAATFRLTYEPLADGRLIRVRSIGRDGELTRTLQQEFRIVKHLDAALISPNRIMIGKNVHIEGPIGSRYGEYEPDLSADNGHPIVIRSDFLDLDDTLDIQVQALIDAIATYDIDGDNRLRPLHPGEAAGLIEDYMIDYNDDGFVDDYDLWLSFFDINEDGQICYDPGLAQAAGLGGLANEFENIDDQLVAMIDTLKPDRNGDSVVDYDDIILGYSDGVINDKDAYSKIQGRLLFKASRSAWEAGQGGILYQSVVNGPIHAGLDESSTTFEVPDDQLFDISISDFTNSQTALKDAALAGLTFDEQLTAQLGGNPEAHVWSDHPTEPDYLRPDIGIWEEMPIGSPGFYDWYKRPIYKNMTFVDVKIPMGNNGLFINCMLIGAVYVEIHADNDHQFWNFLGMKELVGSNYVDKFDYQSWEPALEIPVGTPIYDTKPFSNNIRFDSCIIIGSVVSDPAGQFAQVRNKLQFTGNTTFTLDPAEIENANLEPDQILQTISNFLGFLFELQKSSLMLPNFSIDVGNFANADEKVKLLGTIVAGVMDIRGSAYLEGTLLSTYSPVEGEGPLFFGGSTASFNTTIGYFGPEDGDGEGQNPSSEVGFGNITIKYNPDLALPDGIMAPIKTKFVPGSYVEGGGS